jgi:hypothetical protein
VATFYSLARPTLSTSNVTTYTTAATLYIANAPAAAGSATITNPYALYVAAGNSLFAGNLLFTDNTYDIGASGATRPRNFYLAGIGNIGGNLLVKTATSRANITTDANLVSENGLGILATSTTYGQSSQYIRFFNSAAGYAGSISQTASGEIGMYSGGNLTLGVNTSTNAGIFTATTLNLFSAGINTWGNNYKALDLAGSFVAANGPNTIIIGTGTYIDSSNTLYTVASTAVSSYSQSVGGHQWSSAAGGSIGAPAALTQKMYLNPNGNFYLGNISAALATANILTGGAGGGVQLIRNASGNPTSGQSLGSYAFKGVDSANSNAAAEAAIEAFAAENHTGSTAATSLVFFTKPSGTGPGSSPVQAGMFTSSGLFGVGLTPTANNYFIQSYGGVRAGTSVLAQGTLSSYTGYGFFMSWESTYGRLEAYDYGGSGYQNIGISPNGGSVGVGMVGTSTYGKLSVNGNIAQYGSVASGAELGRIAWFNTATGYDVASIRTIIGAGQVNRGELSFYTNNGASQLLAMYIDRNQFVGVGNVPAYLLDVNNNSTAGVAFAVRASGITSSQVNIGVGVLTAGRPFIGTNTSSNPLEVGTRDVTDLVFVTNSSERFRIDTSGNQTQTGTVRSQAGVVTTSQLFDINASTNRRVQVVLNNYTWTKFRIYGLRTNSGNSVCYWEGVLNNNFNTSYTNTIVAVNGSGGTITLTVSSSSSGVWDFDFNNTGSGASGYFVKEDPGYGTVTVTTY